MWRVWFLAARPKTLLASVCPVAIGTALAQRDGLAHCVTATSALIGAISIQVGTNFCNDYFDFRQGADTSQRKGPTRAVQAGWVSPKVMLSAALAAFTVTAAMCVYLVARAGWPLALIGAISILCGIGYTASRFSLSVPGTRRPLCARVLRPRGGGRHVFRASAAVFSGTRRSQASHRV